MERNGWFNINSLFQHWNTEMNQWPVLFLHAFQGVEIVVKKYIHVYHGAWLLEDVISVQFVPAGLALQVSTIKQCHLSGPLKCTFSVTTPVHWNEISPYIQTSPILLDFQRALKIWCFSQVFWEDSWFPFLPFSSCLLTMFHCLVLFLSFLYCSMFLNVLTIVNYPFYILSYWITNDHGA